MKKLTRLDIENLSYDIIKYCKDWGFWSDMSIYGNGKRYEFNSDDDTYSGFKEFKDVNVKKNINPKDYIGTYVKGCDGSSQYESLVPKKHILSVTFEGPLYDLLNYTDAFEIEISSLSNESREFYPKKTNLALVQQEELTHNLFLINSRPRKCLGWKSPIQVFLHEMAHLT